LDKHRIALTINGETREMWVSPNQLLLDVLRDELALTGTKYGCGIGECGLCTVHVDGRPYLSCLELAIGADGREVETIEGIAEPGGSLHPLQAAFLDYAAVQCGYCTPGLIMTAKALLDENPTPGEEQVRDWMRGTLCRCTGYAGVVRAVLGAAGTLTTGQAGELYGNDKTPAQQDE
jgi:carbon-monoxide dehydrogenase small subunit